MKIKALFIAATFALFSTASNADFIIDLSGALVGTPDGAFTTIVENNGNTNAVTGIAFDFTYDAGIDNDGWGSEMLLQITHLPTGEFAQIGTQADSCVVFMTVCTYDLMWGNTDDVFSAADGFAFDLADGSGDYEILIATSFDQFGTDGMFLDGSSITLIQQAAAVPAPATLLLIGIGLLGMGAARRRA